jgi:rod shape-determining protein MreD
MRIIFNIFLILILVILQISFFPLLNYPANNLNLILTVVIFITVILSYRLGFFWAILSGVIIDLYSINSFGIVTLALVATVFGVNILFDNFFTNRSFYSLLMLELIGTVFYNFIVLILNFIFYSFKINVLSFGLDRFWFYNFFWQIILNLILISIIFLFFNLLSKKLKSVFLIR